MVQGCYVINFTICILCYQPYLCCWILLMSYSLTHFVYELFRSFFYSFIGLLLYVSLQISFWEGGGDLHVAVFFPRPMVHLGKPIGTTSSNRSSKTLNSHTPQALLVSGTSKNYNYSSHENSNLGCGEASAVPYQLYHTSWWFLTYILFEFSSTIYTQGHNIIFSLLQILFLQFPVHCFPTIAFPIQMLLL